MTTALSYTSDAASDTDLCARGVRVSLQANPILRGVDLTVLPGETVALLGGNGSGKTTLVRSVLGLQPIDSGRIDLFGTPLVRFRDWHRIGYVPQRGSNAFGNATVREIVASGRLSRRRPFVPPRAADRDAVRLALARVGLADRQSDELARLSGGQQQRALIARALVSDPELVVLDEPLAGLDLRTQDALARLLGQLKRDGLAILVVLHELGPLEALIDRSVVLREGLVIHDGPLLAGTFSGTDHHHPGHDAERPRGPLTGAVDHEQHHHDRGER